MIAITGAAGFIGSRLAQHLARQHYPLLLVDCDLPANKLVNLMGIAPLRFLDHQSFLNQLESGSIVPEAIFHLGACSSTTETNWDYLLQNNVVYSQRLWTWAARARRPFIYASSAATYGDGSAGFSDRTPPEHLRPMNLYGKSKNDFDIWALNEARNGRLTPSTWAGMKFFNVYGPGEAHKGTMCSVVLKAYRQILSQGEVTLFRSNDVRIPDGGQLRDFVFVDDCIAHMLWLWQRRGPNGIYNSGTGQARSFFDLARGVYSAMNLPPRIRFIDMPESLSAHYQNYTQAEMGKLREVGCKLPSTSLEEGIRRYVAELHSAQSAAA
ncbi:ADP-glyceromanno-heptose 6-epimerase [Tuwongella immobilis]|uniref:NAD-dependent epimerase/dehydratase domain-containing protein n=1 Tax=Tuwongella immobilis TaxID=692036 RepID=A0A6C2YXJ8_9BACT|nr:ADP-glyceromanno-heptose 6-epimerase [Tuwongella immobilis]VIP05505.1 adp-l-glycero-d-manno-heptose-6-epimerase : ADP-L-glycero-D-manno-heptose-6-epimerase OS=Singulisphaera acidiphila (strain ATCC BAA-1392 / DSM 18658 / VKM B-2454 / MOB10) GN=Sinac_4927 PE=4 SV=1: Epimerase [Tuwongella immobilis]VTS08366.1 adp-l-glycero-d-manno-heptose-6-epimerase : ADP-L-glycero-D-manno-heptose-6-epimerase OS=Singulisphaera acidiphila (strain ATCC BAA-1392 / DSM 18658 / VKM B-2454 / MOB10) GN=Sinac_4927 PE=4